MTIKEIEGYIIPTEEENIIVNTYAKDFCPTTELGKKLEELYKVRQIMKEEFFDYSRSRVASVGKPCKLLAIVVGEHHYSYYDYGALQIALFDLKNVIVANSIKNITMPMLGCDANGFTYKDVKEILMYVFSDVDVNILIKDPRFIDKKEKA